MTPEACRGLSAGVLRSGLRSVESVKVKTQLVKLIWDPQRFMTAKSKVCKRWQTDNIESDPKRSQNGLIIIFIFSFAISGSVSHGIWDIGRLKE